MRPIDYLMLCVLAVAAAVSAWLFIQDWAAKQINTKKTAIKQFLAKHNYVLYELGYQDTSPSGMKYTIVDGAKTGLTPLKFYRLIKKAHRDLIGTEIENLYEECKAVNDRYLQEDLKRRSL